MDGNAVIEMISTFLQGNYHMWFIFTIVGLYMITPLLRKITADKVDAEYYLKLSFIFCCCVNMLKISPFSSVLNTVMDKSNLSFVMGYACYYILGHYLHTYPLSKKTQNLVYALGLFSLLFTMVVSTFYSYYLGETKWEFYAYLLPTTYFESAAVFLLFKNIFSKVAFNKSISVLIERVSALTFGMYLVHEFFNVLLNGFGLTTQSFTPYISIPVITILVFVLSAFSVLIISKLPLLNRFIM